MFCLLHQAHCLGMSFGGMPWHSNERISRDANMVLPRAYCDLSNVSNVSKICQSFFFTGHQVLGILFVLVVGTQVEMTLPIH